MDWIYWRRSISLSLANVHRSQGEDVQYAGYSGWRISLHTIASLKHHGYVVVSLEDLIESALLQDPRLLAALI